MTLIPKPRPNPTPTQVATTRASTLALIDGLLAQYGGEEAVAEAVASYQYLVDSAAHKVLGAKFDVLRGSALGVVQIVCFLSFPKIPLRALHTPKVERNFPEEIQIICRFCS